MREVVENKADISQQEARDLVERCLKVLYYRDARSYNRVGFQGLTGYLKLEVKNLACYLQKCPGDLGH